MKDIWKRCNLLIRNITLYDYDDEERRMEIIGIIDLELEQAKKRLSKLQK